MSGSILYLGDTHLTDAAAYLAGLMHSFNWEFDYIPSDQQVSVEMLEVPRSLFVISDYPAARMSARRGAAHTTHRTPNRLPIRHKPQLPRVDHEPKGLFNQG